MPAKSKAQQRFFGMVRAAQKGELKDPPESVSKAADSMKKKDVRDFARTKHEDLPERKEKAASWRISKVAYDELVDKVHEMVTGVPVGNTRWAQEKALDEPVKSAWMGMQRVRLPSRHGNAIPKEYAHRVLVEKKREDRAAARDTRVQQQAAAERYKYAPTPVPAPEQKEPKPNNPSNLFAKDGALKMQARALLAKIVYGAVQ